jgi:hypothetical protein
VRSKSHTSGRPLCADPAASRKPPPTCRRRTGRALAARAVASGVKPTAHVWVQCLPPSVPGPTGRRHLPLKSSIHACSARVVPVFFPSVGEGCLRRRRRWGGGGSESPCSSSCLGSMPPPIRLRPHGPEPPSPQRGRKKFFAFFVNDDHAGYPWWWLVDRHHHRDNRGLRSNGRKTRPLTSGLHLALWALACAP